MSAEAQDDMIAGAIPWCQGGRGHTSGHGTDWVDGCPYCEAAQGIRSRVAAHYAATGCETWPVCIEPHPEDV